MPRCRAHPTPERGELACRLHRPLCGGRPRPLGHAPHLLRHAPRRARARVAREPVRAAKSWAFVYRVHGKPAAVDHARHLPRARRSADARASSRSTYRRDVRVDGQGSGRGAARRTALRPTSRCRRRRRRCSRSRTSRPRLRGVREGAARRRGTKTCLKMRKSPPAGLGRARRCGSITRTHVHELLDTARGAGYDGRR